MKPHSSTLSSASAVTSAEDRVAAFDWRALGDEFDNYGCAVLPKLPLPEAAPSRPSMREIIRFAWGISSLGHFIVAMSEKGLVTLEFSSRHAAMEDALRVRFPEADVIDSQEELTDIVEKVVRAIEEPGFDPGVPLDLCGTPYQVEVWSMLRALPVGETTSYGALAARLGTRDAREVTDAIARNAIAVLVPCHRVIKKDGSISGYRWGLKRKRELLAREQRSGVFRNQGVPVTVWPQPT